MIEPGALQPSLFVSHGSPTLALEDCPARRFLTDYGKDLGRPKAILVISAHYDQPRAAVTSGSNPPTIYDFGNFAEELFTLTYPAPGDPAMARRIAALLEQDGIDVQEDEGRGFDHGAWVPLILLYPNADIPVVQLSIDSSKGPDYHLKLGQALAPLRSEGVLILCSGSATHNLAELFGERLDLNRSAPDWVVEFGEWLSAKIEEGAGADLLAYRTKGPHAVRNHPTDEHLLPLFVAMGAGESDRGTRVHASHSYGLLAMDAYRFGDPMAADSAA